MPGYFTKEYNYLKCLTLGISILKYKIVSFNYGRLMERGFFLFSSHPFTTLTNQINDKPGLFC